MSATNVIDCMTAYLATAWMATRGTDADPSEDQTRGLRAQLVAKLLQMPTLANASDVLKQEVADSNVMEGLIVGQYGAAAHEGRGSSDAIRAAVAKGAQATCGIDLKKLELTSAGFVPTH
jgi:hypothetical protein